MVRPVRNVRECLALDGEPGVSVAGRTHAAVMSADTLFITIPTGVGVDIHVKILENFAAHIAPALSWQPNREGPVIGYPID
ncbi:hypothetical protein L8V01_08095 [Corynebacterium sp. c8Ua_181]|uniref:Uncharacterized protein n=1 Tax=Corynebacterium curieae TaxID=2913500 RepID=A0A9X3MBD3_9CORY|nr:hypothetical protein [Corynebacterium curieae]MCZ9307434.1 hypothetical protein [Corynebacterium curieae]MDV2424052.1 hypothetical protein [Corynebacterium curieae]